MSIQRAANMRDSMFRHLLVLSLAACRTGPLERPRPASSARAAAVEITVGCVDPLVGLRVKMGSGVAIGPRHVLTAKHVIDCGEGAAIITVTPPSGKERVAIVDYASDTADAARLYVMGDAPLYNTRPVGRGYLERLDAPVCTATAFPRRDWRCGRVQQFYEGDEAGYVRTDLVATFGNSGSGVYDANGNLVGLLVMATLTSTGQIDGMVIETRIGKLLDVQ